MFLMNNLTICLNLILLLIKSYNSCNSFEDKNNLYFLKKFCNVEYNEILFTLEYDNNETLKKVYKLIYYANFG